MRLADTPGPDDRSQVQASDAATADAAHWHGVPFTDLDVRHWLPVLHTEDEEQPR